MFRRDVTIHNDFEWAQAFTFLFVPVTISVTATRHFPPPTTEPLNKHPSREVFGLAVQFEGEKQKKSEQLISH